MKKGNAERFKGVLLIAVSVLLLLPGSALSMQEKTQKVTATNTKTADMTVQSKTREGLLTKEYQLVRTNPDTEFFDGSGRKITFEGFPAPCRARVEYEPIKGGDPRALKVTIRQTLPGASVRLPEQPE